MNITSKRLDKIKKTKNQSKRRIHYKNKKKNGKEKNRRKNRKYNKSTGKYRKTHKRKKRAYDLKNKSLKFKENQPVNKSATLKIITTDKPVETVQTGGDRWDDFKKLFKRANTKKKEEIEQLKDEIFAIIRVNKDNDNVADFYKWYIDELLKIAFEYIEDNPIYKSKRAYYERKLIGRKFKTAILDLDDKLKQYDEKNKANENKADRLYNEGNKEHLINIFKYTLTDDKTHLKRLFNGGTPKKYSKVAVAEEKLETEGNINYKKYEFNKLTAKMDEILEAVKAEKKKREKEKRLALEEKKREKEKRLALEEEKKKREKEEKERLALEEKKKREKEDKQKREKGEKKAKDKPMKTEEEINNIKTNIKTKEFEAFLEKVIKDKGPYSVFLDTDKGNTFKNLIENSKVMTGGADDKRGEEETEGGEDDEDADDEEETDDENEQKSEEETGNEEKGTEEVREGEKTTPSVNGPNKEPPEQQQKKGQKKKEKKKENLVEIYDYLMNKDNQDKIRKSLQKRKYCRTRKFQRHD
jgi:hypothetical protein